MCAQRVRKKQTDVRTDTRQKAKLTGWHNEMLISTWPHLATFSDFPMKVVGILSFDEDEAVPGKICLA